MSLDKRKLSDPFLALLAGVALLLVLCIVAQAQDDERKSTSPPSPTTGAISGRVLNENGQPIPHATIYASAPVALIQSRVSVTDDGGNFQLRDLDALVYMIGASAPSYVAAPRELDSLPSYYRIGDSLTINLIKGGVITGTVTSSAGEPVVQVAVRATLIRDANGKAADARRFAIDKVTDDRGVYRFYGLVAGTYVVSAGGRGRYWYATNAYDTDSPTYAPSSRRDTAAEIAVRAGEETGGVDIRYRGETGHAVSGFASGLSSPNSYIPTNITLTQVVNGVPQASFFSFQPPNSKGFAFYGVPDGDYDLIAQSTLGVNETVASEPRRITVKGADINGIELVVKALGSISGHVALETSAAIECKNKRRPTFSETLLVARRSEKNIPNDQLAFPSFLAQSAPNKAGDFVLRNLAPGQFILGAHFFAKYWYLRSMTREATPVLPAAGRERSQQQTARPTDAARNGLRLKFGERVTGLTVTLAEGAASLRGAIKPGVGESIPTKLYAYLVPAEKENAKDVLRFFAAPVNAGGTFTFNNLPPGRYWALARVAPDSEPHSDAGLREPEEAVTRAQVRRAAEAGNKAVELRPCQNVIDYALPFTMSPLKN
jgi:hypothetical protein